MKLSSLTLALTAYNEETALEETVLRALEFLPNAAERWELLIVDDGSTDGTGAVATALERKHSGVRVFPHDRNRGMGAAIQTAISVSKMEWFCTIGADGQVDPRDLSVFIEPAFRHPAVFSTYANRRDGLDRWILSNGLRVMMGILTRAWKIPTGNYFVKREFLSLIPLRAESFFLNFEVYLGIRAKNMSYAWVEIPCAPREKGQSKVRNLRTIIRVARELFRYRFSSSARPL